MASHKLHLHDEPLRLVLGHLTDARDIIRCSVVNKAWGQAIKHTQPRRLDITPGESQEEQRDQVRWLQGMQKADRFDHLHEARITEPRIEGNTSILSQGFVVLAGAWHLTKVVLYGPFCLLTAVAYLPPSLVELQLWADCGPDTTYVVYLSSFRRFTNLKMLWLAIGTGSLDGGDNEYCLLIDSRFVGLELFTVYDTLRCSMPTGQLDEHLPHVQHLSLRVSLDICGRKLAQSVMALLSLHKVKLEMFNADGIHSDLMLEVPKASQIQQFILLGPTDMPKVYMKLHNVDIQYERKNVCKILSAVAPIDSGFAWLT